MNNDNDKDNEENTEKYWTSYTQEDNDKENTSQPFVLISVWEKIKHVWSLITQIFCLFLLNSGNIKIFTSAFLIWIIFIYVCYFFLYH